MNMRHRASSRARFRRSVLFAVAALLLGSCASNPDALTSIRGQQPDPTLAPEDVVQLQLTAFANNNEVDEGIEIGFRFASPSNRSLTGPVERFGRMLRSSYPEMLTHNRAEFGPVSIDGALALVRVTLYDTDVVSTFDFVMRRQTSGEYVNCWMTEAVLLRSQSRNTPAPVI